MKTCKILILFIKLIIFLKKMTYFYYRLAKDAVDLNIKLMKWR
jgi:hypothetical protein